MLPPMEHLGHAATRIDPYAAEDSSVCIVSRSVSADSRGTQKIGLISRTPYFRLLKFSSEFEQCPGPNEGYAGARRLLR